MKRAAKNINLSILPVTKMAKRKLRGNQMKFSSKRVLMKVLLLLFFAPSLYSSESTFTPEGKTWRYEGSDFPSMDILFKAHGDLEFQKGFKWLNPASWKYNSKKQELTMSLPKATKSDMEVLMSKIGHKGLSYVSPKVVDLKSKEVTYKFPARIDFLGFIFEEVAEVSDTYEGKTTEILGKMKELLMNIRRHCGRFPTTKEGFAAIKNPVQFHGFKCIDFPKYLIKNFSNTDSVGVPLKYLSDGKEFKLSTTGDVLLEVNNFYVVNKAQEPTRLEKILQDGFWPGIHKN